MALATRADLKTLLSKTTTAEDALFDLILAAADAAVKTYCGRDFEQATYTDYYSGTGRRELVLRQRPVVSVTNVWEDAAGFFGDNPAGAFDSTRLLTQGTDYALRRDWAPQATGSVTASQSKSGILYRIGTVWPRFTETYPPGWFGVYRVSQGYLSNEGGPALGNVKVTYVAGFASVPADVGYACLALAAWMYKTRKFGGMSVQQESLRDYAYTLAQQALGGLPEMGSTRQLLARYKEVAV